jgi:aryl sulfotransferase
MVATPVRTREYRNHHLDSTRWDGVVPRDDDIIITTAYKAGTTWTQRIVAALVLGHTSLKLAEVSPWVDSRFRGPVEPLLATLEAQRHRRFMKSHLAADGLPYFPNVKYLVVGRDTRDVFMSLWNHYSAYTELTYEMLNDADRPGPEFPRCPQTPRALWNRWMCEGWFDWEADGWPFWSFHHHAATWWAARDCPNVMLVHFNDLLRDTDSEMRRIGAFLEINVAERELPGLLADVAIDAMRSEAEREDSGLSDAFRGGPSTFFYKGTNGRWRDVLTAEDVALYDLAASALEPELRAWLEGGREAARGLSRRVAAPG